MLKQTTCLDCTYFRYIHNDMEWCNKRTAYLHHIGLKAKQSKCALFENKQKENNDQHQTNE